MYLHQTEFFKDVIQKTAKFYEIDKLIVERDYWYAYCIKRLYEEERNITIKGSYVLSKLYVNFNRQPNDLDFALELIDEADIKKAKIRKLIASVDNNVVLKDKVDSANPSGNYSYKSIDEKVYSFRIEALAYSPLGRRRNPFKLKTFIGNYIKESNYKNVAMTQFEELEQNIFVYDKYLMFIDKLLCIFYFTSNEFKGEIYRLYCALYDIANMIENLDSFFDDKILEDVFITKFMDKFKGNFAFNSYSEFFCENPSSWNFLYYRNEYEDFLKNNNLIPLKSFEQVYEFMVNLNQKVRNNKVLNNFLVLLFYINNNK